MKKATTSSMRKNPVKTKRRTKKKTTTLWGQLGSVALMKPLKLRNPIALLLIGVVVVVGTIVVATSFAGSASYSLWASTVTPKTLAVSDARPTELGVKFKPDADGTISAIKFYKSKANGGVHTGSLWTADGTRLATGTFTGESASGWQTMTFSQPLPVKADTVYVASYFASAGHYSVNRNYFAGQYNNGPLHALANNAMGANGVYRSGSSGFPTRGDHASNYWVDVVYVQAVASTPSPTPTSSVTPTPASTPVAGSAGASLGSTGVPAGTVLVASGNISTTINNQVIDAREVTGTIVVQNTGVVVKRTKVTCNGGYYGVQVMPGASATISDVTIVGDCTGAGITGNDWMASRVDISGMTNDGVNMGHRTRLSDSWIHDFHSAAGAHSDGIQGIDTPHDIVITNNLVDIGMDGTNSALIITPWTAAQSGPVSMVMDHNTWGGGGYVFHLDTGFTAGLSVTNSVFLSDYNFGPIQDKDGAQSVPQPQVWTGNVNASGGLQAW